MRARTALSSIALRSLFKAGLLAIALFAASPSSSLAASKFLQQYKNEKPWPFLVVGSRFTSWVKLKNAPDSIERNFAAEAQLGLNWAIFQPYVFFAQGVLLASSTTYGIGARITIVDHQNSGRPKWHRLQRLRFNTLFDYASIAPVPPNPVNDFSGRQSVLRFGPGIQWTFGQSERIFVDSSLQVFHMELSRLTSNWNVAPILAVGVKLR